MGGAASLGGAAAGAAGAQRGRPQGLPLRVRRRARLLGRHRDAALVLLG